MNNYKCEIVADSLNAFSDRITTFKLTYPRIVHSELMTHRMFSRNAASSRAVPVTKMIESVKNNMFTPLDIQKAHKGMQGSVYFEGKELEQAKSLWVESANLALEQAKKMQSLGVTKQLINRILEPYQYYQVLVTATEWENFFKLRCPQYKMILDEDGQNSYSTYYKSKKDWKADNNKSVYGMPETDLQWLEINESQADIHIQAIAELMWDAYNESEPKQLKAGEWHIPFGDNFDEDKFSQLVMFNARTIDVSKDLVDKQINDLKIKIAVARCARISYQTLGDNPKIDYEADLRLYNMLLASQHASPMEHVALCHTESNFIGNFKGWKQHRKILEEKGLL